MCVYNSYRACATLASSKPPTAFTPPSTYTTLPPKLSYPTSSSLNTYACITTTSTLTAEHARSCSINARNDSLFPATITWFRSYCAGDSSTTPSSVSDTSSFYGRWNRGSCLGDGDKSANAESSSQLKVDRVDGRLWWYGDRGDFG